MAITVRIPTPLQKLTGNRAEVPAQASTIQELIVNLEQQYPGIKGRLCDEQGKLRRFVNVYVNEEDIRFLKQEGTALKDGDEVSIIPAIAGGAPDVTKHHPVLGVVRPAPLEPAQRAGSSLRARRWLVRQKAWRTPCPPLASRAAGLDAPLAGGAWSWAPNG